MSLHEQIQISSWLFPRSNAVDEQSLSVLTVIPCQFPLQSQLRVEAKAREYEDDRETHSACDMDEVLTCFCMKEIGHRLRALAR